MSGDNHLKRIAHEYAALAGKWYDHQDLKVKPIFLITPKTTVRQNQKAESNEQLNV